jgi:hypothetical protein
MVRPTSARVCGGLPERVRAQHKVAYLERADADVAAVVATQNLLVPGCTNGNPVSCLLQESEVVLP